MKRVPFEDAPAFFSVRPPRTSASSAGLFLLPASRNSQSTFKSYRYTRMKPGKKKAPPKSPGAVRSSKRHSAAKTPTSTEPRSLEVDVESVVESLRRLGSKSNRDGMARYGLKSEKAFGVGIATMQG